MQSTRALDFYLEELHALGIELSLGTRLVNVSEPLHALAERSPDASPQRADEPYRRALSGIYARLAASAMMLDQHEALRHAVGAAPPYADAAELRADLDVIERSLRQNGSAVLARGRLRSLRRAVDVFGFHLASVDLRQNSDVHARTVGELLEVAQPGTRYAELSEPARIAVLLRELDTARPLASPYLAYSAQTAEEIAILRAAAEMHRRYGRAAVPNYIVSKTDGVSDLLEAALLLKEAGLLHPLEHRLDVNVIPLFETIRDLRQCAVAMDELFSSARLHAPARQPRPFARSDARLLGQQQGRRLPDLRLGTLQGGGRADRRIPPP